MRAIPIVLAFALLAVPAAAAPPNSSTSMPQATWQKGIADENKDYAQIPHAMLKIQDAAYLGEGQFAVLAGVKGQPGSWRWHYDAKQSGPLRIAVRNGKLDVTLNGKKLDAGLAAK